MQCKLITHTHLSRKKLGALWKGCKSSYTVIKKLTTLYEVYSTMYNLSYMQLSQKEKLKKGQRLKKYKVYKRAIMNRAKIMAKNVREEKISAFCNRQKNIVLERGGGTSVSCTVDFWSIISIAGKSKLNGVKRKVLTAFPNLTALNVTRKQLVKI